MKVLSLVAVATVITVAATACQPLAKLAQVGPRPYQLVDDMDTSPVKAKLASCSEQPIFSSDFSIGHRGAAMQFPEHTKESYIAAARMGAGIVECDVTFTQDKALVCRHSQCDLHTTTNILETELASKCSQPFIPANPETGEPAQVQCCTSDITLAEFKTLKGKMDAGNKNATTVAEYMDATPNRRTDLYTAKATLMTHAESIELFKKLNVKMTPELKSASVEMPYDGDFSQQAYAQKMLDEYKAAGVSANKVFPQSFNIDDVKYWVANEPEFGAQAVYLDARVYDMGAGYDQAVATMSEIKSAGINYIAPPMFALVELDDGKIVASDYAKAAKANDINMITWTLERSGLLKDGGGWYYQTTNAAINNDGDMYELLDVLAKDVGIKGIFSDWPATVTYYASCMGIK